MDYYLLFKKEYQREIDIKAEGYKNLLLESKSNGKAFQKVTDTRIKELLEESSLILIDFKDDFYSLIRIYENRGFEYEVNDKELIIKNELLERFENSSISNSISYEELIKLLSKFLAIKEASRIINNSSSHFSMLYSNNMIEQEFIFDSDDYKVNSVHRDLVKIIYPEPKLNNTIDFDKEYTFGDIKFSTKEFAWYMRILNDYYKWEKNFKSLYEYAVENYNDPFNDRDIVKYKNSVLYKYIKDDQPEENKYFKYSSCYMKIYLTSIEHNDKKLLSFISKRLKPYL